MKHPAKIIFIDHTHALLQTGQEYGRLRLMAAGVPEEFKNKSNLVPRVFSLSNMAAAGDKTLAHSRNHVTDLSTESGNLFKMAAKIKSERIWVRDLETGEKQTKWRQRQNSKEAKNMKEYTYKPQEYGRMI